MTTPRNLQPPAYFNGEAREVWTVLLQEILATGNTATINRDRLDALVGHTMRYRRASQLLATTDILVDRDGKPVPNPTLAILKDEETAILRLRREFGLTRRHLQPLETSTPNQPPPLTQLGRWCDRHNRYECDRRRQSDGRDCHGSPVTGFARCTKHLGMSLNDPRVIALQERRLNPLAGEPLDITPLQALMWRVQVLAGEVSRLDARIAALTEDELVFGVTRVEETEDWSDTPARTVTREAKLNMWLVLRDQREHMLNRACENAIRAGVQEQVVDLLKQSAAVMVRALVMVLGRFGIPEDHPDIPVVVPEVIRELTA